MDTVEEVLKANGVSWLLPPAGMSAGETTEGGLDDDGSVYCVDGAVYCVGGDLYGASVVEAVFREDMMVEEADVVLTSMGVITFVGGGFSTKFKRFAACSLRNSGVHWGRG